MIAALGKNLKAAQNPEDEKPTPTFKPGSAVAKPKSAGSKKNADTYSQCSSSVKSFATVSFS